MNSKIIRDLLILIAVFAATWIGFTLFPVFSEEDIPTISIEQEEKLGKWIVEDLLASNPQNKKISNPTLDSAVFILENRLLESMGVTDYNYQIYVVNNSMVNAYALPGGYIIVCKGLIDFVDAPEELAGIIAHEMGHLENRHVISRLVKEIGMAILFSGDDFFIGNIAREAASKTFDRDQEKEADQFALKLMEKAKINPRIYGLLFQKFNRKRMSYDKSLEILMTHPHNNSRIKAAFEYETAEDFKSKGFEIDWNRVKESIAGALPDAD